MIHIDRVKNGMAHYIDNELMPKMSGWQRWVFGGIAMAYAAKLDGLADYVRGNSFLSMLGFVDDYNNVDIEAIYSYIKPYANTPATITVPGMGVLTLTSVDVDRLYNYIINS